MKTPITLFQISEECFEGVHFDSQLTFQKILAVKNNETEAHELMLELKHDFELEKDVLHQINNAKKTLILTALLTVVIFVGIIYLSVFLKIG